MKITLILILILFAASCTQKACPTYANRSKQSHKIAKNNRKVMPIVRTPHEMRNTYARN